MYLILRGCDDQAWAFSIFKRWITVFMRFVYNVSAPLAASEVTFKEYYNRFLELFGF
jgi:hypothetical protein